MSWATRAAALAHTRTSPARSIESIRIGGKETSTTTLAVIGVALTLVYLATTIILTLFFHH
jgi:hypothetical protein